MNSLAWTGSAALPASTGGIVGGACGGAVGSAFLTTGVASPVPTIVGAAV